MVSGDILLTKAKSKAHCVAAINYFESGLTQGMRNNHPAMVKDLRHEGQVHRIRTRGIYEWTGSGGFDICSLLVQEETQSTHSHRLPGNVSLHNLDKYLKQLASNLSSEKISSLVLPCVTTGMGGLNWDEVRPPVYKYLDVLQAKVYLNSKVTKSEKISVT